MTDLHVTSFHFTPLSIFHFPLLSYVSSPRFKSLHFTSLLITFLALYIKIRDLQEEVARASAGSWFQSLMVLYLCVLCSTNVCLLSFMLTNDVFREETN